jgi:hypothetical protein
VTTGHAIQNSVFAAEGQMNAIKECIAFCPMLQKDGGQKNTLDFLVIVEHMWNPLCTNFFIFPKILVRIW